VVRTQIGHLDKAFDAKLARLDKYTEVCETGDYAIKLVANSFAQHLQHKYGREVFFGIFGPLLGKGDVLSELY
jgi:hypothetical protein